VRDLASAVDAIRPTVLIGVSGQPHTFTRHVIEKMAAINERPVIFALSNPTANSECSAEQAYAWSGCRAVFASGSPFGRVACGSATFVPRQANNVYVFPGIGLGIIASGARRVTEEMFLAAARTLAAAVGDDGRNAGALFPAPARIREVSAAIATAVARVAYDANLASVPRPDDLASVVRSQMYDPRYPSYV
jgi:malate dehydrogenase (oxaloacetate-decarboxylating)(NADP+)